MIFAYIIQIDLIQKGDQKLPSALDIWNHIPRHKTSPIAQIISPLNKDSKSSPPNGDNKPLDRRLGEISVWSFDNKNSVMAPADNDKTLFSDSEPSINYAKALGKAGESAPSTKLPPPAGVFDPLAPLVSGESSFGHGIIHLYRDPKDSAAIMSSKSAASQGRPSRIASDAIDQTILCVLAVPAYMTPSDFLNFAAPVRDYVSHFRLLRDTTAPNKFMVLMKFLDPVAARDFYKQYNGRPFSSMEPEICHVVYIKSVEIHSSNLAPYAFPIGYNDDDGALVTDKQKGPAAIAKPALYELPTCPVCLERMDSSVTGLLTILCQHTFHCNCLSKWGDSRCPVCRYTQSRSKDASVEDSKCVECGAGENLWICLICGHLGCGRYNQAHAFHHYADTSHLYALELETQRVWDYAGDGYVHRLIQNKSDGKLVELPHPTGTAEDEDNARNDDSPWRDIRQRNVSGLSGNEDKLDAIGLEYTYLLTSQLESQRNFYEDKLSSVLGKVESMERRLDEQRRLWEESRDREISLKQEVKHLSQTVVPQLVSERKGLEEKLERAKDLARGVQKEWREEREVSAGLLKNLEVRKTSLQEKEAQVKDLEEQLRDMMFFIDARDKIGAEQEGVGGSLVVEQQPEPQQRHRKGRKSAS